MRKEAVAVAAILCLLGCKDHGGVNVLAEIAVPSGTAIQRIDLVTPDSMGGDGAPKPIRREAGRDVYRLDCLAFFHETRRLIVVETENHVAGVIELPAGRVAPSGFTAWRSPQFFIRSEYPAWSVMNGDTSERVRGVKDFRARYSFSEWHSTIR